MDARGFKIIYILVQNMITITVKAYGQLIMEIGVEEFEIKVSSKLVMAIETLKQQLINKYNVVSAYTILLNGKNTSLLIKNSQPEDLKEMDEFSIVPVVIGG